jgi:hypothetical protein
MDGDEREEETRGRKTQEEEDAGIGEERTEP